MDVAIIGAGVAGLSCGCELVDRGLSVTIYEQSSELGGSACSWLAGGMLAPWCEQESAEQIVVDMGIQAKAWWQEHVSDVVCNGSLVLSLQRDMGELKRFSRLTQNHQRLDKDAINALEPDLLDRFEQGLWFSEEAHLNPRQALRDLAQHIKKRGGEIVMGTAVNADELSADRIIDTRGYSAKDKLKQLRGVKGEMIILHTDELHFSRPIRLLHPRYPLYIVPRDDGQYMLGATMIENGQKKRVSALSMLELLSSAYALHPGFGEAQIVEINADVRPAFNDNLPALMRHNKVLYINGLYRHGFLLGPAMATQAADVIQNEAAFMALDQCA